MNANVCMAGLMGGWSGLPLLQCGLATLEASLPLLKYLLQGPVSSVLHRDFWRQVGCH